MQSLLFVCLKSEVTLVVECNLEYFGECFEHFGCILILLHMASDT